MKINREVYPAFTWLRENNDLFPREQHPDQRSNAEFLRVIKFKKEFKKTVKKLKWYPNVKQRNYN